MSNLAHAKLIIDGLLSRGVLLTHDAGELKIKAPPKVMTKADLEQLKANKSTILAILENNATVIAQGDKIPKQSVMEGDKIPLSFAQQRLLFVSESAGQSIAYNMPICLKLEGALDVSALQYAFDQVVTHHQVLRTKFVNGSEGAYSQVYQASPFEIAMCDLSHSIDDIEQQVDSRVSDVLEQPFNLQAESLLIRANLIKHSDQMHTLVVVMHHIASDGWSNVILMRELCNYYQSFLVNKEQHPDEYALQYVDFAMWQQHYFEQGKLDGAIEHWTNKLAGLPVLHSLPTAHKRGKAAKFDSHQIIVKKPTVTALKSISNQHQATLFMTLYSSFVYLLSLWGDQKDVVVGTPVAGRARKELESVIGCFVNTVVLRSQVSERDTFDALLKASKQVILDAFEYQNVPFEMLVEKLNPPRSQEYSPLFQIWFVMQNNEPLEVTLPSLAISEQPQALDGKYELNVYVTEQNDTLTIDWLYNSSLYDAATIAFISEQWSKLLDILPSNSSVSLETLSLFSPSQANIPKPHIQAGKNEQDIYQQFKRQAQLTPSAIAVVEGDEALSYCDLLARVEALSECLPVRNDSAIGLMLGHGVDMVTAILACLKNKTTYVPLDANYPIERLCYIVQDAGISILLTGEQSVPADDESVTALAKQCQLVTYQGLIKGRGAHSIDVTEKSGECSAAAYYLYTSGSTGQPKGVVQSRENMYRHIENYIQSAKITEKDKLIQLSSFSFDSSIMDMFGALLSGAQLQLVNIQRVGISSVIEFMASNDSTILHLTPSVYRAISQSLTQPLAQLRLVVLGGEEVVVDDLELFEKAYSSACQLILGYGLTESTMALQWHPSRDEIRAGVMPKLGSAVIDDSVTIENAKGQAARYFEVGEIVLSHENLATMYWQRPDETAKAFVESAGKRTFRTGDYGMRLPSNEIQFVGRRDEQVKLNGIRIELAEIEGKLRAHELIGNAAVVIQEELGNQFLVAYIEPRGAEQLNVIGIKGWLRNHLPDFMLPQHYVIEAKLPMTPSGKLHKALLPEFVRPQVNMVAPKNNTEQQLLDIWQRVFKLDAISTEADFFDIGGHSLLIIRAQAQLRDAFKVELSYADLIAAGTIANVAEIIDEALLVKQLKQAGKRKRTMKI